jgi:hypothetical protein
MSATLDEQVLDQIVLKMGEISGIGSSNVHRIAGPREFAPSELPAITVKRLAESTSRWHLRGAQEEVLRVRVRGLVAAASPDEFTEASALMGSILTTVDQNDRWHNGVSNLAERSWIERRTLRDPAIYAGIHVVSVIVAVLIRLDRVTPTVRKGI